MCHEIAVVPVVRVFLKELSDITLLYEGKIHLEVLKIFLKFHMFRSTLTVALQLQRKNLNTVSFSPMYQICIEIFYVISI
jgi:hypothetical protein